MSFTDKGKTRGKYLPGGYFTVEAAMIVPLVIILILLFISLSFFLYNRCRIVQDGYLICFRASRREAASDEERKSLAGSEAFRQLSGKYFALSGIDRQFSVRGGEVEMTSAGRMKPPAGGLLFRREWIFRQLSRAKFSDPAKRLRRLRGLREETEKQGAGEGD